MLIRFSVTDRKYMIIAHIYLMHVFIMARAHDARVYSRILQLVFFHTFIRTFIYSNHFPVMIQYNHILKDQIYQLHRLPNDSDMRM